MSLTCLTVWRQYHVPLGLYLSDRRLKAVALTCLTGSLSWPQHAPDAAVAGAGVQQHVPLGPYLPDGVEGAPCPLLCPLPV